MEGFQGIIIRSKKRVWCVRREKEAEMERERGRGSAGGPIQINGETLDTL